MDGAVGLGGVAGGAGGVATDGDGRVRVQLADAAPPLHREGVDIAVQVCHYPVRQTGSCGGGDERKK